MPLGLYISVPFCRTKCSYCNFASDVFSRALFQRYVERVCSDIARAAETTVQMGCDCDRIVDSVYLGGGTPTILDVTQLERLFVTISQNFDVQPLAEITMECAPGTLSDQMLETFGRCGVNRVSLGVQSFVDVEAAAVGRLHKRVTALDDIARLRATGISNLNIDLIAGLPHQNATSWDLSLNEAIASGAPHVSVYMLEVDDDSRLGRELIAGGTRYHAHSVPDDEITADFYVMACERLEAAGVRQYEISNFAREGWESRHNLKYWTRQPYLGFGVDAHSMLRVEKVGRVSGGADAIKKPADVPRGPKLARGDEYSWPSGTTEVAPFPNGDSPAEAVRFSTPESLEEYVAGGMLRRAVISQREALEEVFFLGLRLTRGVDVRKVAEEFGQEAVFVSLPVIDDFVETGLIERQGDVIRLTPRGRLLSNEVFERFISLDHAQPHSRPVVQVPV